MENTTKYFHEFRVDHILGFFRIYAFPWIGERNQEFINLGNDEVLAKVGRLPRYFPREDDSVENMQVNKEQDALLLSMLKRAAGDCEVIGEDLGAAVPRYVRMVLNDLDISGYTVFPLFRKYGSSEILPPSEIPELSLATFGTHDHMPLQTIYSELVRDWHGPSGHSAWLELQRIMRAIGQDDNHPFESFTQEFHELMLSQLFSSPARRVVLNFPDLVGSEQRWNNPAKEDGGNWTGRLFTSLGDYAEQAGKLELIERVKSMIQEAGR